MTNFFQWSVVGILFTFYSGFISCNVDLWKCANSFLDLPTIFMKGQEYVDVCIPLLGDVMSMSLEDAKCGTGVQHACIGVRFLKTYNIPLYAGVHFQNAPDVVLGLNRVGNYPNGRPIGKSIVKDDGRNGASDVDLVVKRTSVVVKADGDGVVKKETWSEAAWSNDRCEVGSSLRQPCTSENNPTVWSRCPHSICCWDNSKKECFRKIEEGRYSQCDVIKKESRESCSFKGTSQERCQALGCCYDDETCFNPIERCQVEVSDRKRCGIGQMEKLSCFNFGCCWSKDEICYMPAGKFGHVFMSELNQKIISGTENYSPDRHVKGQLVYQSLVKRIKSALAPQTSNLFNTFVQYAGANIASIPRETQIENIMYNCLNTKGIKQKYLTTDFYFITGTKPIDVASLDKEEFNGMNVPQLQWSAMCCVLQFKEMAGEGEVMDEKSFAFSRGYVSSNEKPVNAKPTDETSSFHVFPKDGDPALLDLDELKDVIQNYAEERTDNPIDMTVESFFGAGSICDVKTKKTVDQETQERAYFDQFKRLVVQQAGEDTLAPGEALKRLEQFFRKSS
eukprot:TCONS_00032850-protein